MPSRARRLLPLVLATTATQASIVMGARTASAQLGYMVGAAGGGLVLAIGGFGTLGFVLFAGMAFSALLLSRVGAPTARQTPAVAAGAD